MCCLLHQGGCPVVKKPCMHAHARGLLDPDSRMHQSQVPDQASSLYMRAGAGPHHARGLPDTQVPAHQPGVPRPGHAHPRWGPRPAPHHCPDPAPPLVCVRIENVSFRSSCAGAGYWKLERSGWPTEPAAISPRQPCLVRSTSTVTNCSVPASSMLRVIIGRPAKRLAASSHGHVTC